MSCADPSLDKVQIPEPLQNLILSWNLPRLIELAFYEAVASHLSSGRDFDPNRTIPLEVTVCQPGMDCFRAYGYLRVRRDGETGVAVIVAADFQPVSPC